MHRLMLQFCPVRSCISRELDPMPFNNQHNHMTKFISNINILSCSIANQNGSTSSVLVASSAIRTKEYMPRRLSDKARHVRPRRFRKREKTYSPIPFRAPVKAGEEIDVVIDDIGSRGDGITRIHGYLIFVPKAKVGERLRVKIVKTGRKFALAEKIELREEEL